MNISFIVPMFHKANWLCATLPINPVYRHPGVEVILVVDDREHWKLDPILAIDHGIRFKVLVNDGPEHEWRPPCIPVNVGVRHATANHIAILSPESILRLPSMDYLIELISRDFRAVYGGICWNIYDADPADPTDLASRKILNAEATNAPSTMGYGFIMTPKVAFEQICGMDESRLHYAGDDNDIRYRLARVGCQTIIDPNVKIFHLHHKDTQRTPSDEVLNPNVVLFHQRDTWGKAKFKMIHDWEAK